MIDDQAEHHKRNSATTKNMYSCPANGYSAPLLKQETTIDSEIKGILSLFKISFSFFLYTSVFPSASLEDFQQKHQNVQRNEKQ
jgi:hypothetical protein